jgi:hypothetical protein
MIEALMSIVTSEERSILRIGRVVVDLKLKASS